MAGIQVIEQTGSPIGRLGKGIGKGLADQIPKEIDRYRLSSGLEKFSKESMDKSPFQQAIDFYKIPGITPQMIETFGQLAREQQQKQDYLNQPKGSRERVEAPQLDRNMGAPGFADLNKRRDVKDLPLDQQTERGKISNEPGQPQIVNKNPLRQEAVPRAPWSPAKRNGEIRQIMEDFPRIPLADAKAMAADNEARELAQPIAEQAVDKYFKEQQVEAREKLNDQLGTLLQKKGDEIYKDIIGESLVNITRGMERDLRTNPNATVDDVVNDWSTRALDFAKAKTQLNKLSADPLLLFNILKDKKDFRNKLKAYQDIYSKIGNKEEFRHTLQNKFDMSPQGSALIAYEPTKAASSYIEKVKPQQIITSPPEREKNARKQATDLQRMITADDSPLALAKALKYKDPYFDEAAFFAQLLEDQDETGLTPRQRTEIGEGTSGVKPSWGDVLILPFFREF